MAKFLEKYRKLITASHKMHVIVVDRDDLFKYAELQQAVKDEGYTLIDAETSLELRIKFELEVRNSSKKNLIVTKNAYFPPPDIRELVHFVSVGLHDIFPCLDAKSLEGLSFNALCRLSNIKNYDELGQETTLKFLLENLYFIDFDSLTHIKPKEKILHALTTVFFEGDAINQPLHDFLVQLAKPYLPGLVQKGLNKDALLEYLQKQWATFLSAGHCEVDFEDPVLNKSFGQLFVFDHLNTIKVSEEKYVGLPRSLRIGAYFDEGESNDAKLSSLIDYLAQQEANIQDLYEQWFNLVQVLAKAKIMAFSSKNPELKNSLKVVTKNLNSRFQLFIDNTYSSLFSLTGVRRPVYVGRVLEYINAQPDQRKLLLTIDGLNFWQWLLIERELLRSGLSVVSKTTLAFIPTITAWSRQSLFRGSKPNLNESNSGEVNLFKDYWVSKGYSPHQIDFIKFGIHQPLNLDSISGDVHVLSLLCNDLDEIMHGSKMGNDQLMSSTLQWIEKSQFVELMNSLKSKGFKIFITTDHGNVEATGIKNLKLKEKVGSLSRGKRYIQFSNEMMVKNFREQNPDLIIGEKDNSVYLRHKEAFTTENVDVVTHGGSHIWEVLIPLGEIN